MDTRAMMSTPIIHVIDSKKINGRWTPAKKEIAISLQLLRNYEWEAVEYILKHEIAHQIVSEVFDMECVGVSHGEAFKVACVMLGIECKPTDDHDSLSAFKGSKGSKIVTLISKLLIHANDSGATQGEAEAFMYKAKELMVRHNIKMGNLENHDRVWIKRPFGSYYSSFPSWLSHVGHILTDHYNVKSIITSAFIEGRHVKRLELFGEIDDLDIAEYVGHALMTQANYAYSKYKKETLASRKINGKSEYGFKPERLSKLSFLIGVYDSYNEKMISSNYDILEKIKAECGKMVSVKNASLLREMYGRAYPNMSCTTAKWKQSGAGYNSGVEVGKNMTIAKSVKQNGNRNKLLV